MKVEIKNVQGVVIFCCEAEKISQAVKLAVLQGAGYTDYHGT